MRNNKKAKRMKKNDNTRIKTLSCTAQNFQKSTSAAVPLNSVACSETKDVFKKGVNNCGKNFFSCFPFKCLNQTLLS